MMTKIDQMAKASTYPSRKCKKTRRGKKKKLKSLTDSVSSIPDKNRANSLRPSWVPQAPQNSTQFIMDDHENCNFYFSDDHENCNLYLSFENGFESPGKEGHHLGGSSSSDPGDISGSPEPFPGFEDIDYEYLSPDDLDTNAFYERDFELTYRKAREEKLLNLSRESLIASLLELEDRSIELENRLAISKTDPGLVLDRLQEELLKLQDKNRQLINSNRDTRCANGNKRRRLYTDDDDEDDNNREIQDNLNDDVVTIEESSGHESSEDDEEDEKSISDLQHDLKEFDMADYRLKEQV